MKKFLLGALCALSAASAFSYDCSVLLLDSPTNTILASYHGYSGGYDMCRDELRACNKARRTQTNPNRTRCEKLDRYYSGTGTYNPGGVIVTPGPQPIPTNPPGRPSFSRVTIVLEDEVVQTSSTEPTEVYLTCMNLAQRMGTSIDQITVTASNGNTVSSYNSSSYWSDQSACMLVQSLSVQSSTSRSVSRPVQVSGQGQGNLFP